MTYLIRHHTDVLAPKLKASFENIRKKVRFGKMNKHELETQTSLSLVYSIEYRMRVVIGTDKEYLLKKLEEEG